MDVPKWRVGKNSSRKARARDLGVQVPVDAEVVDVHGGLLEGVGGLGEGALVSVRWRIRENGGDWTDLDRDVSAGEGQELPHVDTEVTAGGRRCQLMVPKPTAENTGTE